MPTTRNSSVSGPDRDAVRRARLQTLQRLLCARFDEVLQALEVSLDRAGRLYQGCCPIHGGDNPMACTFYPQGDQAPGYWRCYTRGCEKLFKATVLGFIRGMLSQKRGWSPSRRGIQATFDEAVTWACNLVGRRLEELDYDIEDLDKVRFVGAVASLTRKPQQGPTGLRREQVRSRLEIPAPYYLERGYEADVLDRYDVGLCLDPRKPFFERAVVPVYGEDGKSVVGLTARSIHPRCPKCKLWHRPQAACPQTREEQNRCAKWTNSADFRRESHLYNWWSARKAIEETGVAVLVEGPGDIWRLEEAGIGCGLALLGNRLTDEQQVRLEMSGAMTLVVALDDDDGGATGKAQIRDNLARCYRLVFPELSGKDIGDMSRGDVQSLFAPLVEKHKRTF